MVDLRVSLGIGSNCTTPEVTVCPDTERRTYTHGNHVRQWRLTRTLDNEATPSDALPQRTSRIAGMIYPIHSRV